MKLTTKPIALKLIAAGFLAATALAAEKPAVPPDNATPFADLKSLSDPTILVRRVWLETEWNKFNDGSSNIEETLGALWAWSLSPDWDWAVRLKLPYNFRVAGDAPEDFDDSGFGDIRLATGAAVRLRKNLRAAGALELRMPTGENNFSDNVWRIQEFGALGWDVTPWLTLSPSFEYNQSFSGEGGAPSQNFIEVFFPALFILPHKWIITAQYELKADFENNNYVTNSARIQVSKELENIPLAFTLSAKRSFDAGEKDFQINFIVTYFFR